MLEPITYFLILKKSWFLDKLIDDFPAQRSPFNLILYDPHHIKWRSRSTIFIYLTQLKTLPG